MDVLITAMCLLQGWYHRPLGSHPAWHYVPAEPVPLDGAGPSAHAGQHPDLLQPAAAAEAVWAPRQ